MKKLILPAIVGMALASAAVQGSATTGTGSGTTTGEAGGSSMGSAGATPGTKSKQ